VLPGISTDGFDVITGAHAGLAEPIGVYNSTSLVWMVKRIWPVGNTNMPPVYDG